ncbi:heterocycloanthracin/sonorensin family bacteriocin [Bacillus pacificus]
MIFKLSNVALLGSTTKSISILLHPRRCTSLRWDAEVVAGRCGGCGGRCGGCVGCAGCFGCFNCWNWWII